MTGGRRRGERPDRGPGAIGPPAAGSRPSARGLLAEYGMRPHVRFTAVERGLTTMLDVREAWKPGVTPARPGSPRSS